MSAIKKIQAVENPSTILTRSTGEYCQAPARLAQKAIRAWNMQARINDLKASLDALKAELLQSLEIDQTLTIPGVCKVIVSETTRYEVTHPDALEDILGERFEDLVKPVVKFELEPRLKEMLLDADDVVGKIARGYVKVKPAVSVTLKSDRG